jgi:hypothetical protein
MSKALTKRIDKAYNAIYRKGDSGLDYMDGHCEMDQDLMEHFYNDTVDSLSKLEQTAMAVMLETIVSDMEFDLV